MKKDFFISSNPLLQAVASSELYYEAQEKRKQNFLRWGAVGVNNFYRINLFVCIIMFTFVPLYLKYESLHLRTNRPKHQ